MESVLIGCILILVFCGLFCWVGRQFDKVKNKKEVVPVKKLPLLELVGIKPWKDDYENIIVYKQEVPDGEDYYICFRGGSYAFNTYPEGRSVGLSLGEELAREVKRAVNLRELGSNPKYSGRWTDEEIYEFVENRKH